MFLFFIFSLLILQIYSCPLTDEYLTRCHCGILTNGNSYIKCEEKTLTQVPSFKRSFPYDELILSNNNIRNLSRSSFDIIKTIRRINLEANSLSFIDADVLRSLGNYLEELILTGDNQINSLEFLIRYPLNNLRVLKLNHFDLSKIHLEKIFLNMTKLEILSLRSCQIKQLPNLSNIQILDLENNQISNSIDLSTSYVQLNLASNFISSISLQNNSQLKSLNLSKNNLNQFVSFPIQNPNLTDLNLSYNSLASFDFTMFNENLTNVNLNFNRLLSINLNNLPKNLRILSINNNLIKQIKFPKGSSSLETFDLSFNQLKYLEKNSLFEKLNYLNLQDNPLECKCQLEWLRKMILAQKKSNASTWTCFSRKSSSAFLSTDFQCPTPRIAIFNISYVKISTENGLFIQWSIIDDYHNLNSIQISISEPFYLTPKLRSNQTEIFLSNHIQSNHQYHICLILLHKYARDKYCREFLTDKLIILMSNEIILEKETINSSPSTPQYDLNLYMMLIGSGIGGIITFLLIFICCYLCFQIRKFNSKKKNEKNLSYYSRNVSMHYPVYHPHPITCPYHQENISNSTDSSQIDTSLSTTNLKHIYQTIDSQDYSSLKRENQLFDLWNESLRQKR